MGDHPSSSGTSGIVEAPAADGQSMAQLRTEAEIPGFRPAPGISNCHLQTILAAFRPPGPPVDGTVEHQLRFTDGDATVVHDNRPEGWTRGDKVALLMHGLCGSHSSGYMVRICRKLMARGVRVFRMDHRGCGAGRMLARHPYHAGRIRDLEAAVRMLERLCPSSPVSVAGFSLSGNLLLRYLGDQPDRLPLSLERAVAVCPPIDLHFCVDKLGSTVMGRRYDWYFARQLTRQIIDSPLWRDDVPLAEVSRPPRRLIDFDELYTAPASGFASAATYYAYASARRHLPKIGVRTSILASQDDPTVSSETWNNVRLPPGVNLCLTPKGGHLGYLARRTSDADQFWMDWRVVDWLLD